MTLPDDQLRIHLEAAIAAIRRFDDITQIGDKGYAAIARAKFHLALLLARLDEHKRSA